MNNSQSFWESANSTRYKWNVNHSKISLTVVVLDTVNRQITWNSEFVNTFGELIILFDLSFFY